MSIAGENYHMEAVLTSDVAQIDWDRLALIFKRAPLGDRDSAILRQVFTNSGVRCFAWIDQSPYWRRARDHRWSTLCRHFRCRGFARISKSRHRKADHDLYLIAHSGAENFLLHSVLGKEGYYSKFGFRKMKPAMARFRNPEPQQEQGYIE